MSISLCTSISTLRLRPTSQQNRSLTTEMLSDKGRVLTCSAFRRLQTKAQVFSLERNAAVRTRLTHTLEVSIYGELIAGKVVEMLREEDLPADHRTAFVTTVENACLLHDIGNPPFGHLGEFAIRDWFKQHREELVEACGDNCTEGTDFAQQLLPFEHFDGNPQGFRIVSRLQWLQDQFGLNLTCTLLASIIKYLVPTPSERPFGQKIGYFQSDSARIRDVWECLGLRLDGDGLPAQRHPLAFIMEAADDIAYSVSDIEDAIEKGVVTQEHFRAWLEKQESLRGFWPNEAKIDRARISPNGEFLMFKVEFARQLVDKAAGVFVESLSDILAGSLETSLLKKDDLGREATTSLKKYAKQNIYSSSEAVDVELSGYRVIHDVLDGLKPLLKLDTEQFGRLAADTDRPLEYGELALESRLYTLLPKKHLLAYRQQCQEQDGLEPVHRIHLIVDYLSGMTDSHAMKVFSMLSGTSGGN